jgi:16S rRNA (cytosine1402-N4)-methyltransferase
MSEQNIGSDYHIPVLYYETLDILNIQPDGVYVDCTFGGGGHSRGILERLGPEGRLVAFDQDADAKQNLPDDDRILFVPQNFRYLKRFLRLNGINGVDGILADLGVSSHQFDEGERGFSIRFDGPLDMRMDQNGGKKASDILLEYDAKQLQDMFSNYGEVTNSKTLAQYIVQHRSVAELKTIDSFKGMLQPIIKGNPNKYLAQVFQALRIEVNSELDALKEMLEQIPSVLNTGGIAAIITFHSLEDRLVKIFFKEETFEEKVENPFENSYKEKELKILTKKPIVPTQDELKKNARSRSSKLRAVEKL